MEDKRSLYINQLLNHYRYKSVFDSIELYPVTYRYENADKPTCLYFRHNEVLDVINGIKQIEGVPDNIKELVDVTLEEFEYKNKED